MPKTQRLPLFVMSFCALCFEILIFHLLVKVQWGQFVGLIIGLGLVGYGLGGTFLAFCKNRLNKYFWEVRILISALFSVLSFFMLPILQIFPFNPSQLVWDIGMLYPFFFQFSIIILPFFLVSIFGGLYYLRAPDESGKTCSFDLLGASLGAIGAPILMLNFQLRTSLLLVACIAAFNIFLIALERKGTTRVYAIISAVTLLIINLSFSKAGFPQIKVSPYKPLSKSLLIPGTKIIDQMEGPAGEISLLENETTPFRDFPGLSIYFDKELPIQSTFFVDAEDSFSFVPSSKERIDFKFVPQGIIGVLPLLKEQKKSALILGGGTTEAVALISNADYKNWEVVTTIADIPKLIKKHYPKLYDRSFSSPNALIIDSVRGHLSKKSKEYDLIALTSWARLQGGYTSHGGDLTRTVEGLDLMFEHLSPDGILLSWSEFKHPPLGLIKYMNILRETEKNQKINLRDHLLIIKSLQSYAIILKKSSFSAKAITSAKDFCRDNNFELIFSPYQDVESFIKGLNRTLREPEKFNLTPSTDDHPFFSDFLSLRTVTELLFSVNHPGVSYINWQRLLLLPAVGISLISGLFFIFLPIFYTAYKDNISKISDQLFARCLYFSLLGLAFFTIEIVIIERLNLYFGLPLYAFSLTLCLFLLFAGLGSLSSAKLFEYLDNSRKSALSCTVVCLLCAMIALTLYYFLGVLDVSIAKLSILSKFGLAALLIAPLAFMMGMPFPLGIRSSGKEQIAIVYAANGFSSVLGSLIAQLTVLHQGIFITFLVGVILYLMASIISYSAFKKNKYQF